MPGARQIRFVKDRGSTAGHASANGHGAADRRERHHPLRRSARPSFDLHLDNGVRLRRQRRVSDAFTGIPELARNGDA